MATSSLIVFVDVHYRSSGGVDDAGSTTANIGIVWAEDWVEPEPLGEATIQLDDVADYESGSFYQRELPCLLAAIETVEHRIDRRVTGVVVDGNVRLDPQGSPGLGQYLFDALEGRVKVIGVAKNPFRELDAHEVLRGESERPVYVTAAGLGETEAAELVQRMGGSYRIPDLIRRADQLSRSDATS